MIVSLLFFLADVAIMMYFMSFIPRIITGIGDFFYHPA